MAVPQGTVRWLAARRRLITASEAAALIPRDVGTLSAYAAFNPAHTLRPDAAVTASPWSTPASWLREKRDPAVSSARVGAPPLLWGSWWVVGLGCPGHHDRPLLIWRTHSHFYPRPQAQSPPHHSMEPVARSLYERVHARRVAQMGLLTHPRHTWLGASVDGIVLKDGRVLEIKCPYSPKDLQTPVPLHYWIQVQVGGAGEGLPLLLRVTVARR